MAPSRIECIARCSGDSRRCADGSTCWSIRSDHPDWFGCFPGGATPLGAACTYVAECVRGAICVNDVSATRGTCRSWCAGRCALGDSCDYNGECASGFCAEASDTSLGFFGHCGAACARNLAGDPSLCADGGVCWDSGSGGVWGCFEGGAVAVGAPCTRFADCLHGSACLTDGTMPARCFPVCNTAHDCSAGQTCTRGICG